MLYSSMRYFGLACVALGAATLSIATSDTEQNSLSSAELKDPAMVDAIFTGKSFLDNILQQGTQLSTFGDTLFGDAMQVFPSEKIAELKASVHKAVSTAHALHQEIVEAAAKKGITLDSIKAELESTFSGIFDELKAQFPAPEQAPTHENRMAMVNTVLELTEESLLSFATKLGISRQVVQSHLSCLKSHIQAIAVTIGEHVEQHPELAITLLFATTAILLPEYLLLVKVLRAIGLGPQGPIKGGVAAWVQSWLFGATIPKGRWFALLQRLGMVLAKL